MSLSDLAAIGSFVSGVAVVVSFVFLALQIRQGNRNQRALMQQGRAGRTVELLLRVAEPALHESMMRGASGDLTLEPAKADVFVRIMIAAFVNWEDAFLQNRMGAIDPAGRAADEAAMRGILTAPSYRAAWKTLRYQFGGDYRDYVDAMLRQAEPTPAIDLAAAWKANLAEELASHRPPVEQA
jgi:hypothetical protein